MALSHIALITVYMFVTKHNYIYLKMEDFINPLIKDNTDVQFTQENNLCLQFFNKKIII